MNVFCIEHTPRLAAKHLNDRHCVKMIAESAQLLANCYSVAQLASADCPRTQTGTIRKHSHYNHPSSLWVRRSLGNARWLITHAEELCLEKLRRWPENDPHASTMFIQWCAATITNLDWPIIEQQPFVGVFPVDAQCRKVKDFAQLSVVEQYRWYYRLDKHHIAQWRLHKPAWYEQLTQL